MANSAEARDRHSHRHSSSHRHAESRHHHHDRDRVVYLSHPRSSFTLSLGTGYAGRGYYYGPPGVPYYYERPDVRYYSTRAAVPREYYGSSYRGSSDAAAVQDALARRGYYRGVVDGSLGPRSRQAIADYQADNGMRPTGAITPALIDSLDLD